MYMLWRTFAIYYDAVKEITNSIAFSGLLNRPSVLLDDFLWNACNMYMFVIVFASQTILMDHWLTVIVK